MMFVFDLCMFKVGLLILGFAAVTICLLKFSLFFSRLNVTQVCLFKSPSSSKGQQWMQQQLIS